MEFGPNSVGSGTLATITAIVDPTPYDFGDQDEGNNDYECGESIADCPDGSTVIGGGGEFVGAGNGGAGAPTRGAGSGGTPSSLRHPVGPPPAGAERTFAKRAGHLLPVALTIDGQKLVAALVAPPSRTA